MTDRPIIFSGPMVRALLDGRKTQTRRLATSPLAKAQPGDRLYVREAWFVARKWDEVKPSHLHPCAMTVFYAAGGSYSNNDVGEWRKDEWPLPGGRPDFAGRPRPGRHMPRWASRLTLIVEAVRFEPLQAISEEDARAEGVTDDMIGMAVRELDNPLPYDCFVGGFAWLWNSLHAKPGERWEDNPELVALTFRVERGNIDRIAA